MEARDLQPLKANILHQETTCVGRGAGGGRRRPLQECALRTQACCGLGLPGLGPPTLFGGRITSSAPGAPRSRSCILDSSQFSHQLLRSGPRQALVLPPSLTPLTYLLRPSFGLLDPSFELPRAAGLWKVPPVAGSSLLGSHLLRAAFPDHPGESFAPPRHCPPFPHVISS